jgi:peptide/nickel transport system substrate-binding protein
MAQERRVLILLIALSLFAPGVSHGGTGGNELILAIGGEPEGGFDPTTGWGRYGSPLFQSTLYRLDEKLNGVNDLAVRRSVSPDGKTWTVTLRKDAVFSDNTPVCAVDVAYTFDTAKKSSSVVDLTNLESVRAVDRHTVEFVLIKPQSTFLYILAHMGIVPKHAHTPDYSQKPIGSGPFQFVRWDKGQQLIVTANPHYYGKKPFFRKITFLYLSEEASFAAAKAGKVDVAAIVPLFAGQKVRGMRLEAVDTVDNRGIMFPTAKPFVDKKTGSTVGNAVTSDPAIRKAVNIAVDRHALVQGILNGYGSPAYSVCDGLPWWNPETVFRDGDMKEAAAILEKAGWAVENRSGIREKNGIEARFRLVYPSGDQIRQFLAIAVADRVKPLGIVIDVDGKSWDDIRPLMHANAVLFGWGSQDPVEMFNLFRSRFAGKDYFNPGYYLNPAVDRYLDSAMFARNEKDAAAFWKKSQWDGKTGTCAKGDSPWAWLVNIKHLYLVRNGLDTGIQKIHPHGHGWPFTDNILLWKWKK